MIAALIAVSTALLAATAIIGREWFASTQRKKRTVDALNEAISKANTEAEQKAAALDDPDKTPLPGETIETLTRKRDRGRLRG